MSNSISDWYTLATAHIHRIAGWYISDNTILAIQTQVYVYLSFTSFAVYTQSLRRRSFACDHNNATKSIFPERHNTIDPRLFYTAYSHLPIFTHSSKNNAAIFYILPNLISRCFTRLSSLYVFLTSKIYKTQQHRKAQQDYVCTFYSDAKQNF